MAIDDNTSYELTGYQVKDLAQKIRAKADSASLASVATSGLYSDLTGAPTIPTVYNGTLTITQGGNTLGTFTANSSTNETIDIPAGGSSYTAGTGIDITNGTISIDHTVVAELSDLPTVNDATLTITQNGTTAGTFTANQSTNETIALTDTTYTAGTNVQISAQNVISATDTTYSDFTGATSSAAGTHGLVPAPSAGDENKVLSGAGTWVAVSSGGSYSAGNGISIDANNEISIDSSVVAEVSDIPTQTSDLTNDGADGTSTYVEVDELATVATSGSYTDLINTPSIPAAQVNSDWNAVSGVAEILNKPSLATVATTGAYSDLTGTPTIPTVNDATLTITQNGTSVGTFTANASSNATIALTDTTYSTMTGATSGTAGTSGLVPAPAAGDEAKVLSGAGTWVAQSGGGSTYTAGNGISIDANNEISIDTSVVAELSDLPTVNDGTLTIQHNGTTKGTFTANQSTASTVNIETIYADTPGTATTPAASVQASDIVWSTMPFNYSTTEVDTGCTWIDGSHIYRKTINFGALPNATAKSATHGISNLGHFVDVRAIAWNSTKDAVSLSFASPSVLGGSMSLLATSTGIDITTGSDRSSFSNCYVTLWYTKSS